MAFSWKEAAKGALGGAVTGFTVGGPWGALAGGIGGGALGGFGGEGGDTSPDPQAARLENARALRSFGTQALTPAMQGRGVTGPGAAAQEQLLTRLGRVATGEQMGAGEMAVRRQGATAQAQQAGAAMGARGLGANAVAAGANRQAAAIGTEVAGRAGETAMQEQSAANQMLGTVAGQRVAADLKARGMDDAQVMGMLDYLARLDIAEQQGRMQQEQMRMQAAAGDVSMGDTLLNIGGDALPVALQGRNKPGGGVPFSTVPASTYRTPNLGTMA